MSQLKRWGELYELHKESNRGSLVKSLYKNRPIKESWPYIVTFVIYLAFSVFVFYLSIGNFLYLSLVIPQIFVIYFWIDILIQNKYKELYSLHKLNSHPFFQRTKHVSYLLFSKKLDETGIIQKNEVQSLIDWENSKNEKHQKFSFFNTPIILIILTSSSGLVIEFLKSQNLISTKYLPVILILIFLAIWFSWAISDTLKTNSKRNLEICHFLKWWKEDNNA